MATNTHGLCTVCANIDLKEYFRREIHVVRNDFKRVGPSQDALPLGALEDIVERSEYCSFCHLVIESICKTQCPVKFITPQEVRAGGTKQKTYLFSYLYADNRGSNAATVDSVSEKRDSQQAYRIGIGFRDLFHSFVPLGKPFPHIAGDIQLSAISAVQCGMPRLCHGRVFKTERVDMGMASDWLSECENHHKQKCALPDMAAGDSASPAGPQDLLVVDVLLMNLCRMPHGSRYMTLSYCWPKVNTFVTTKSNVTELYIPGALKDNEGRMIQAIQDAIQCVSELGERYLWVDALCIIQDDEQHKSSQIHQMDRVYESSLLTLIHALPEKRPQVEAHNGFVGYRKGSRIKEQDIYQVQGMELLNPLPDVDTVIRDSPWATRAWTFQEERLSRRKLYFTETQMYFRCSCAVFCEDSVGEGMDPSACIYPNTNLSNSSALYSSVSGLRRSSATWLTRTPIDNPVEAIDAYARLIAQFSGRQMSDSRDIIASFEGILSILRESLKTDFWFGLPEKYLHETLLWTETGLGLRRNISINLSSEMTFPSWSWAGWDTTVELGANIFGPIYPEVDWFVINQSGEATQLVTHNSYNSAVQPRITSSNRNVRPPAGLPDDFLKTVQHQAGMSESKDREVLQFLACWTCVASFGISDEDPKPSWSGERLTVLDNVGHRAGFVFMVRTWKDNIIGNRRTFEFMLLSRSSELGTDVQYFGEFDDNVFTFREWCYLNVMLIQRDGDRAQRVSIGVIHEDAWVEANPVPMLIKLE